MGAFPEDYEIKASRLIRLWVAEGFLKSNGDKSLEDEAEDCLKALVGRNLVSVRALKSDGRPKRYGIHDLMRDLCLKKAEEQKFVHVRSKHVGEVMYSLRRVSVHPSYRVRHTYASAEFMSLARSFLCTGLPSCLVLSPLFLGLRMLRVLDVFEMNFDEFPTEILHIVNLRYLAFSYSSYHQSIPSGISRLCNLQTLVICSTNSYCSNINLPSEIWEMAELKHVMVYKAKVTIEDSGVKGFILEKLQRISKIDPEHDFLHRVPNIKYLGIKRWLSSSILDLYHLHKLETLKYSCWSYIGLSPSTLRLPPSLRKLSLSRCKIGGEFMKHLCEELPNLQVLKLKKCEFKGGELQEWDATQIEFSKLHFLLFEKLRLVHWQADETNFPILQHLVIRGCSALEKIPSGMGEIPTLQTIELDKYCSPSLVASAELIIEEQRDLENYDLQLLI